MGFTQEDREELTQIVEAAEARSHHKISKRTWWERLGMSALVAVGFFGLAKAFHVELMFKGAELVLAAAAHWTLFGTAD